MEERSVDEESSATDVREAWHDDPAEQARSRAQVRQGLFGGETPRVQIGRYIVLGTIGAGGMGVVYRAYDPELDRKVALKLVRVGAARSQTGKARMRLLREGQAMAKLAHPNVVPVFDTGTAGDDVFIAMEHVEGVTLVDWLRQRPRTWREAIAVFVDAARGLAAAHAAGIVHRDFKPTNVLVGVDGRARVLDFGLARALESRDTSESSAFGEPVPEVPLVGDGLTEVGAVVGTPAYIAPERLQGGAGDEKSDQYSFAVALFEALSGARPFATPAGAGPAAWVIARETPPPRPRSMPRWVHRVIVRALAFEPAARHPSMHSLIAALGDDPMVRARRAAIAALVVIGCAGIGYEGWAFTRPGLVRVVPTWHDDPIAVDSILVDGRTAVPDADGRLAMEAGLHRIELVRADFVRAETIVEVVRGIAQDVPVPLVHEEGRVDIEVEPRGAAVVIDGVEHGSPLREHRIDTGTHEVWIHHDGWYDRRFELRVQADEVTRRYVALAPGAVWSRPESGVNLDLQWIGDVDGDGKPELAQRNFNTVTAHDPWHQQRPWRISFGDRRDAFTRFADLDGDGVQDLVSLHHDGKERVLAAWSARTTERAPKSMWMHRAPSAGDAVVAPVLADADGDGDVDVIAVGLDTAEIVAFDGRRGARTWRVGLARDPLALALVHDGARSDAAVVDEATLVRVADPRRRGKAMWSVPSPLRGEELAKLRAWAMDRQVNGKPIVVEAALDADPAHDLVVHTRRGAVAYAGRTGAELWRVDVEPRLVDVDDDGDMELFTRDADGLALRGGVDGQPRWRRPDAAFLGVVRWNETTVAVIGKPGGVIVLDAESGATVIELDHELEVAHTDAFAVDWDGDGREDLAATTAGGVVAWRTDGSTIASLGLEVGPKRMASTVDADGDGLSDLLLEANGPQLVLGPRILWRRRSADAIRAQPIARDFNGDGRIDLAQFAAFGGHATLHLLDGESGIIQASGVQPAGTVIRGPAAIATDDGWDVVHEMGTKLARFSGDDASIVASAVIDEGYASPSVADLDGDGRREVLTVSWDWGRVLRVYDAETLAVQWSRTLSSGAWGEPLAIDIDDDRALEVVVSQLDGVVVAVDGAEGPPIWRVDVGARNVFSPLPFAWHGEAALVTSASSPRGTKEHDLVVLRAKDGRELRRFAGRGHARARAAATDVDADGDADLVVGAATGTVVALSADGDELWRHDGLARMPVSVSTAVIAVDLDDDGTDEILVGDDDGRLRVLDGRTGALDWAYQAGDTIEAPPLAVDVDLDGVLEVVVGSHDRFLVCLRHFVRTRRARP